MMDWNFICGLNEGLDLAADVAENAVAVAEAVTDRVGV